MIYINESSNIVEFPRASKMIVDSLVIINQTTKQSITVNTEDSYNVDLTDKIDWFVVGQYDYQFKYLDTIVSCGILQFGDYTPTNETYNSKRDIIQYTPN